MNNNIVQAARGWIGTRFHHQGRLKKTDTDKGGVDCLGLLIGVAAELNLPFTHYDETSYSHYPDTQKLRNSLAGAMQEISIVEIRAGDILLFNIDNNPQHLAIVSDATEEFAVCLLEKGISQGRQGEVYGLVHESKLDAGKNLNQASIIHAYAPARAVVEHALDDWWRGRVAGAFRVVC